MQGSPPIINGEVAEWSMAVVLKTTVPEGYRGFESLPLRQPSPPFGRLRLGKPGRSLSDAKAVSPKRRQPWRRTSTFLHSVQARSTKQRAVSPESGCPVDQACSAINHPRPFQCVERFRLDRVMHSPFAPGVRRELRKFLLQKIELSAPFWSAFNEPHGFRS